MADFWELSEEGVIRPVEPYDVVPNDNGDLGASNNFWDKAFVKELFIGNVGVSTSLVPSGDGTKDLGTAELRWGNAFAYEVRVYEKLTVLTGAEIVGTLKPDTDNSYDLGASGKQWQKAWLGAVKVTGTSEFNSGGEGQVTISGRFNNFLQLPLAY